MKLAAARRLSDNYGWSKFDLSECPRINDRQPGRGFATPKNADFCIYRTASLLQGFHCHCERSEAIPNLDCFVTLFLAMTLPSCHCSYQRDYLFHADTLRLGGCPINAKIGILGGGKTPP